MSHAFRLFRFRADIYFGVTIFVVNAIAACILYGQNIVKES